MLKGKQWLNDGKAQSSGAFRHVLTRVWPLSFCRFLCCPPVCTSFIFRQMLPFCLAQPTPNSECSTSNSDLKCYPSGRSFLETQYKLAPSIKSNSHSLSHNLLFPIELTTTWSHLFHLSLYSSTACLLPGECQVHESKNSVHLAHNCIPISNHRTRSWQIHNSWMDAEWGREKSQEGDTHIKIDI